MIGDVADWLGVSRPAAMAIAGLIAIQVVVQIVALVDLTRRPVGSVRPNRWLWLVVILFGNLAGAVVYLAAGRRAQPPVADPLAHDTARPATDAQRAVDLLYGPDERR